MRCCGFWTSHRPKTQCWRNMRDFSQCYGSVTCRSTCPRTKVHDQKQHWAQLKISGSCLHGQAKRLPTLTNAGVTDWCFVDTTSRSKHFPPLNLISCTMIAFCVCGVFLFVYLVVYLVCISLRPSLGDWRSSAIQVPRAHETDFIPKTRRSWWPSM